MNGSREASSEAIAAEFARSIESLSPLTDREGRYDYAPVRVRTFVSDLQWPDAIAISVRAVVFRRGAVVIVRLQDGQQHPIPGGRREAGEAVEQTLRREVLEETGWHLKSFRPLGFEHVRHFGEPPSRLPPSGFVNPVFVAEGLTFERRARDLTQSEAGSRLLSIPQALRVLPDWSATLVRAAAAAR